MYIIIIYLTLVLPCCFRVVIRPNADTTRQLSLVRGLESTSVSSPSRPKCNYYYTTQKNASVSQGMLITTQLLDIVPQAANLICNPAPNTRYRPLYEPYDPVWS